MRCGIVILLLICSISCSNFDSMTNQTPPTAYKKAEKLSIHNDTRIDNYFWMRLSDEQKESGDSSSDS